MKETNLFKLWIKILLWVILLVYWIISFPDEAGYVWEDQRHDLVPDHLIWREDLLQRSSELRERIYERKEAEQEEYAKEDSDKISEESDKYVEKDSLNRENRILLQIISDALNENHWSASWTYQEEHIDQICSLNLIVCEFITLNWNYSLSERLKYKAIVIYLINQYDNFLTTNNWLADTISSLRINESTWRRWYAGHHTIMMNTNSIDSYKEFWEVLTHEFGHIIDLWILRWTWWTKHSSFTEFWKEAFYNDDPSLDYYKISWLSEDTRKSSASRLDFVSWYALTNPFEDFAESVNMYLNHYWVFKEMAKTSNSLDMKFRYMKRLFGNRYLNYDRENAQRVKNNPEWRPRDSTKI